MLTAIGRKAIVVELELKTKRLQRECTILEPRSTQLFGQVIQNLDIVLDVLGIVLGCDGNTAQDLAFDDVLGV